MTQWSAWDGPVTNRFRVGIDVSRSGSTVTITYRAECTQSINQEITLRRTGDLTGNVSFRMNHGSSGGVTTIGTYTRSISAGQSLSFGASLSGVYNGASPSISGVTVSADYITPNPPYGVSVSRGSDWTQNLSWSLSPTAAGPISQVHVERRGHNGTSWSDWVRRGTLSGTTTSYADSTSPGWRYQYRVRTIGPGGWGDFVNSDTIDTTPRPMPSVSVTRLSDDEIRVSWTSPDAAWRTGIQVQRRVHDGNSWSDWVGRGGTLSSSASSYTDSTGSGRRYQYRVRAGADGGLWSSYTTSSTIDTTPNAPSGISVSRSSDTQTVVSWSLPSGWRTAVQLQRRHLQANGSWTSWTTRANLSSSATSYTDSTTANRRYQYQVRAGSGSLWSAFSASGWFDTTPAAPSGLQAVATASGIYLTWTNEAWFSAATRIERQEGNGAWVHAVTRGSGWDEWLHTDPDLTVTHRYRARAEGQGTPALNSGWAYSNRVELAAPPSAPTGLGPATPWDATEDRRLTWRHTPTDGSAQESFQVRHRLAGGSWITEPEALSQTQAWVLPAGTYANGDVVEWQVRTWGVHPDPSPWSATAASSPQARPTVAINTPTNGAVVDASSVLVSWGYADGQDHEQVAWRLTLLAGGEVVQEYSDSGDESTFTLDGLADEVTYTLRVEARAASGLWSLPDEATFEVAYAPPPQPELAVAWQVETGAAVVQIFYPDEGGDVEMSHSQLWRAIDDGPWVLIADEIPLDTSVTDPIPAIGDGRVNYYRARAVSVLPSTVDSEVVPLVVPSTGKGGTGGWVYLNAGPGMDTVCRVRANATRSGRRGRARELRQFAGRTKPVPFTGTARSNEWDVAARVAPDFDGASTDDELAALQDEHGDLVCYRDPTGKRWFAAMGPVSDSARSIIGEVSFSMTEVDHHEGLATERRTVGVPA